MIRSSFPSVEACQTAMSAVPIALCVKITPLLFPLVPELQKIIAALKLSSLPTYLGGENGFASGARRTFQSLTVQPPRFP
jgi:hypothetical protein